MTSGGFVSLVGAGPGDPGLITVKGLERLKSADAIVFDRLANPILLEHAAAEATLIDVGKAPGDTRMSQDEINVLLVKLGSEGKRVCRLKGGDPFVFGRGGEEAIALAHAGIPWEVVPGVTSAIAAPAYAGIPVTHRGAATSVTFITGSEDPGKPESQIDFSALSRISGTIVFLMGWTGLPKIVESLIENGMAPDRPSAIVQWGTMARQKAVSGPLRDIAATAQAAGLSSPAAFIVGEVAELRDSLRWFDNRPLFGKRVLVTRTRTQASRFRSLLEAQGAECVELPSIAIAPLDDPAPLDDALNRLSEYDWVVFSSANGIRAVAARLDATGGDARRFSGVKVAAVGPATADCLRESLGLMADLIPEEYVSEAVVAALKETGIRGKRVLAIRSDIGRDVLERGLTAAEAIVDAVAGYSTVTPPDSAGRARAAFEAGIDITTFTSSSGVDNFLDLLDGDATAINGTIVGCMGPITAARARERGIAVAIVSPERTMEAFTEALMDHTS